MASIWRNEICLATNWSIVSRIINHSLYQSYMICRRMPLSQGQAIFSDPASGMTVAINIGTVAAAAL
jgi:hypothetical protein